jgi:alanyl-tRNA synthetase
MNMTEKLYERDSLRRDCSARVRECVPQGKVYGIVLDQTVLFPEGGGQLSDQGTLVLPDGVAVPVSHVSEKDGIIFHRTTVPIVPDTHVRVVLDWDMRLDHMQQHCGEHLLSYAFWKLFGLHNVGFHMGNHTVAIDLDGEVDPVQAAQAEALANSQVWANLPVRIDYVPHTKAADMVMRKRNENLKGMLRIVSIQDSDVCTCCGTHPPFTGMVGLIKLFKLTKHKVGTRVDFLCGRWALEDICRKVDYISTAGQLLSAKDEDVCDGILRLKTDITALHEQLRRKTEALQDIEMQSLVAAPLYDGQGRQVIAAIEDDYDSDSAKSLLQKLEVLPHTVIAIVYHTNQRVNYIFALGKDTGGDCSQYIRKANDVLGGKGGGKSGLCQGSAAFCPDWQEKAQQVITYITTRT